MWYKILNGRFGASSDSMSKRRKRHTPAQIARKLRDAEATWEVTICMFKFIVKNDSVTPTRGVEMQLSRYLQNKGVPQFAIDELLRRIPSEGDSEVFWKGSDILDPDRLFYWPGQSRFVIVGSVYSGDGVAIDTQERPGAVFYISHEELHSGEDPGEVSICVADSPEEYYQAKQSPYFPVDYWHAKESR